MSFSFVFAAKMSDDPLQLMAEDETFDADTVKNRPIEFLYTTGMACPISDCNVTSTFNTKAKYARHWEERHVLSAEKYECAVKNCKKLIRRKSDMRSHLRFIHKRPQLNRTDHWEMPVKN